MRINTGATFLELVGNILALWIVSFYFAAWAADHINEQERYACMLCKLVRQVVGFSEFERALLLRRHARLGGQHVCSRQQSQLAIVAAGSWQGCWLRVC